MRLDLENIDEIFQDSLEGIEITPSAEVKETVSKRMVYRNMLKSTYFKITSSAIVLLLLSSAAFLIFSDNSTNNNITQINSNETSTTVTINDNKEISNVNKNALTTEELNINPIKENNNSNNINLNNEKLNNNNNISENNIEQTAQKQNIIPSENQTDKLVVKEQDIIVDKTENINQAENKPTYTNSVSKTFNENSTVNNNANINSAKIAQANYVDNSIIIENEDNKVQITETNLNSLNNETQTTLVDNTKRDKEYISLIANKGFVTLENNFISTVPEINIPNDTVGFTATGEEIIVSSNKWFVGLNIAPNYSFSNYSVTNIENTNLVEKLNSTTNSSIGYSIGLEAGYYFKNIALISGIDYTQFNEKFNAEYNKLSINNIDYWDYTNHTEMVYDTISYINLDSLIQGDSSFVQIIDSSQVTLTDSTLSSRTDSSYNAEKAKYVNQYTYIEIPLTIEYTFNRVKKFSPFVRTGLITGLHIKTKGLTYSLDNNNELIESSNNPYIKANFWLLFGAGVRYNINDKFSLLVYPYYRYNLSPIINDDLLYKQSINSAGLKVGVRYLF